MARALRILLAGPLAAQPDQGGIAWITLQYALGFERLGHEVFVVEPVAQLEPGAGARFRRITSQFGLERRSALVPVRQATAPVYADLSRTAKRADVLVNLSGILRDERLIELVPIRAYLDLDPVFTQLWHAVEKIDLGLELHNRFFTVGLLLASEGCPVPTLGLDWISTPPPVVLSEWPVAERIEHDALTTVANWRGYGSVEHEGVQYGQKVHSLREFIELPTLTDQHFALALAIHEAETKDVAALVANRWELLDPRRVAGTPYAYRAFVEGSKGEFGIAKSGYVVSRSGWFSDRSACYLASGRPVVAQETGFSKVLPAGAGLFAFDTTEDVLAAVGELRRDYGRHARAARAVAEEYLDSDLVLTRILREAGALPMQSRASVREVSDEEITTALGDGVATLRSRPSAYRSSSPIIELDVSYEDGSSASLLLKDLSRSSLAPAAHRVKPAFLYDPLREIETYRSVLAGAELGTPRLHGAVIEPERDRYWLLMEKVPGVELYQVGELATWAEVMRWLAHFHENFAGRSLPPPLLRYDREFLLLWSERARAISGVAETHRYKEAVERLIALPTTLVHGELYASNMLVGEDRVCAVDWETAGSGQGVIDVAALTMGWDEPGRATLVEAYREALSAPAPREEFERDLDCARIHLALRWLGWAAGWSPPPEHAHDWRVELSAAAGRLGL